ncbi:MAG: ABC transporter permease [Synergistaceae bacterium]|jgi:peptide/nickel transport system permease protein|nr:ABC transporter permease [Synergistaceae bacterium]
MSLNNPAPSGSQESVMVSRRSQFGEIVGRLLKNQAVVVGFFIIALFVLCALFPAQIAPYGYDDQNLSKQFVKPCAEHWFGTDDYGRDIFSRIVYGSRISLSIGLVSISFSCVLGVLIGCAAGYYGSVLENTLMRLMDIMLAMPSILLAIAIVSALGAGLRNLVIAIGISTIPQYARIVRASVLSVKDQEFIEAARCIGANDWRILMKHILPNCMAPIIVQATMNIAIAILSAASLSFIGLGIAPPTPEWGAMLSSGRAYLRDHWFIVAFPGVAIMLSVFAFNLFGDGLRDALDPRLKS